MLPKDAGTLGPGEGARLRSLDDSARMFSTGVSLVTQKLPNLVCALEHHYTMKQRIGALREPVSTSASGAAAGLS